MDVAYDSNRPVFVVGCPRSGTTLITGLLNQHSSLAIIHELWFVNFWQQLAKSYDLQDDKQCVIYMQGCFSTQFFLRTKLDVLPIAQDFLASTLRTPEILYDYTLRHFAQQNNKRRGGEKCPGYEQNLEYLLSLYPQAKIIYMIRDPRAVYASLSVAPWNPGIRKFCKTWNRSCLISNSYKYSSSVLKVRYEDLVGNHVKVLKEIFLFLDENTAPVLQNYISHSYNTEKSHVYHDWFVKHWRNVSSPVYTDAVDRWKTQLSTTCIAYIERETGQYMLKMGYQKCGNYGDVYRNIHIFNHFLPLSGYIGKLQLFYYQIKDALLFYILSKTRVMKMSIIRNLYCRYHSGFCALSSKLNL